MKPRHFVLLLALGLLFGTLAAAAMPVESTAAPEPVAKTADLTVSTPAGGCDSNASKVDSKLQIGFAPNLAWLSATEGFTGKCGACGDSICTGQNVGAICGFDGLYWYACINLYGNSCGPGGPGRGECFCTTSGPL